jgi:hypothetical protein
LVRLEADAAEAVVAKKLAAHQQLQGGCAAVQ